MKGEKELKLKQNIIILTTVITISALTLSYLTLFSQSKIAPEFEKIDKSVNNNINIDSINNTQPLSLANLKGKVVLVNFWTYSCINALRTLPHLTDWNAKYADKDLVIVGVHTPEFGFEKNTDFVKTSLKKYGIEYSVIQDNDFKIWNAYGNNYWPRMYLIDDQGIIRYDKIGEGEYDKTEKTIQLLIAERNSNKGTKNDDLNSTLSPSNKSLSNSTDGVSTFLEQPVDFSKIRTPELYFGDQSYGSSIGNPEGFRSGQIATYTITPISNSSIRPNTIYLEGEWKNNYDNVELQSETGRIILVYSAKAVNLVAGGTGQGTVYENKALLSNSNKGIDIKNNSKFVIDYPRLFNIVNHQSYDDRTYSLIIDVKGKGFQAYAFTFG